MELRNKPGDTYSYLNFIKPGDTYKYTYMYYGPKKYVVPKTDVSKPVVRSADVLMKAASDENEFNDAEKEKPNEIKRQKSC